MFLAAPGDEAAALELTYWDSEPYAGGRNSGILPTPLTPHLRHLQCLHRPGVTINRPPRDGRMAIIRTLDGISFELLQASGALQPAETSMVNTGSW